MRVVFYIYSKLKQLAGAPGQNKFFECRNWPIAVPQKGWKITFALRSADPTNTSGQLKTGVVMHVAEHDQFAQVWVDMEEFMEKLQNNLMEAVNWKEVCPSSPPK